MLLFRGIARRSLGWSRLSKVVSGREVQRGNERWKSRGGQISYDLTGRLWKAF